jgi:hypothetical protein
MHGRRGRSCPAEKNAAVGKHSAIIPEHAPPVGSGRKAMSHASGTADRAFTATDEIGPCIVATEK